MIAEHDSSPLRANMMGGRSEIAACAAVRFERKLKRDCCAERNSEIEPAAQAQWVVGDEKGLIYGRKCV